MLGKLFDLVDKHRQEREVAKLLKQPTVAFGLTLIRRYWSEQHELTKDFSKDFIASEAEKMLTKILQVVGSEDPRMANREVLSEQILGMSELQVLVMDPPPVEDPTGLRGIHGISGELKSKLVEVAQHYKPIKEFMHQFPEVKSWDDVWNPILMRYRISHAWAHIFNAMRTEFKDFNSETSRDWFYPYLSCMCGWQEYQVRHAMDMPSLLDADQADASLKAIMLSTFMNRVMEGVRFPDLNWTESVNETSYKDSLKLAYKGLA
jgi:hypothetical protein